MLSVLIAIAATSRLRYPDRDEITDKDAFEKFFHESGNVKIKVEFRGHCSPIEHIFYKWLRCELVREGGIPIDIKFFPEEKQGMLTIRAGGAPEYTLKLSKNWFHYLVGIVIEAPENKEIFKS